VRFLLFQINYDLKTLSGFVALKNDCNTEVYEFDKVQLPDCLVKNSFSGDFIAYSVYAVDLHRTAPQSNIRVYHGNNAITRLHVKIERRL